MTIRKLLTALCLCTALCSATSAAEPLPLPEGQDVSTRFAGTVHRNDLIPADNGYELPQANVISFTAGSHSGWHVHGAMTVIGIAGSGLYQAYGEAPIRIGPGDVVQIPASTSHFHGAAKDSDFQQFVIYDARWKPEAGAASHTGNLSEEEYAFANTAPKNGATSCKGKDEFLFGQSAKKFESPNFNHPVYLRTLLAAPNAAGSPAWTYVAFPKGTYNRWHSHKTGQVLIATDGIGYHQLQGGPLEILHPGDVVYCPPGAIHFHGAAKDSAFAHIAINPADNHEVTWYDFPVDVYGG